MSDAAFDPELTWPRLVALVGAVLSGDLPDDEHEEAMRFLEANLPGAEITKLIEWPGEWFGNRWYEEAVLPPDEVAGHALDRCGRELPGDPR